MADKVDQFGIPLKGIKPQSSTFETLRKVSDKSIAVTMSAFRHLDLDAETKRLADEPSTQPPVPLGPRMVAGEGEHPDNPYRAANPVPLSSLRDTVPGIPTSYQRWRRSRNRPRCHRESIYRSLAACLNRCARDSFIQYRRRIGREHFGSGTTATSLHRGHRRFRYQPQRRRDSCRAATHRTDTY